MAPELIAWYDEIHYSKLYEYEAGRVMNLAARHGRSRGRRLLDVACGTGCHIEFLRRYFSVEGIDILEDMLEIARSRNPSVSFHRMDMTNFALGRKFDVVTCLFSSIGYVRTLEKMSQTVHCMAGHLSSGGILLIEPWFTPDAWKAGTVQSDFINRPEVKIARFTNCSQNGCVSVLDVQYLIGTPGRTYHFTEQEELGLFRKEEIWMVLEQAGLKVDFDEEGIGFSGFGVFIGRCIQQ
jgi:SAM-dependent methyltransferase